MKTYDMEEELLYPEKLYFRNSIVIGDLPEDLDFGKLFSYFDYLIFWKLTGKKIIPDLQNRKLKAVILTYEDEDSARLCNLRFKTASNISFTLYDGILLFHYCKCLDLTCDVRSRCLLISGVNFDKPKDMYFDLLGIFGTVSYLEFCSGEIPKIRVEFTRATSAFAAMLSLQDAFGRDSVVSLEVPLFPVHPIGQFPSSDTSEPVKYASLDVPSFEAEGMKQQAFMSYSMNFYQDQSTFTSIGGIQENAFRQKESIEAYMMEAVAFGISGKLLRHEVNYPHIMSNGMQNYLDMYAQENILRFLQSTKKMMSFNTAWNKIILPLNQHKM